MCDTCGGIFLDGKFALPPKGDEELKLCIPCWQDAYAAVCFVCEEKVPFGQPALKVDERQFCVHCTYCVECKLDLSGGQDPIAVADDGALLCVPCDRTQRAAVCKVCDELLIGQFVSAMGMTFHPACFRCCTCDVGLGEGDVPATKGADNRPYCMPCGAKQSRPELAAEPEPAVATKKKASRRAGRARTATVCRSLSDGTSQVRWVHGAFSLSVSHSLSLTHSLARCLLPFAPARSSAPAADATPRWATPQRARRRDGGADRPKDGDRDSEASRRDAGSKQRRREQRYDARRWLEAQRAPRRLVV